MPAALHNPPSLPATRPNWPTMYDLPYEEVGEEGMPDNFHYEQANLLKETFHPPAYWPGHCYSAGDLYLYYDRNHTRWYKRPDWFGVLGATPMYEGHDIRYSYVTWDEEPPLIVVELLSAGTEDEDLGRTLRDASKPPTKWEVYEQILQVPYYVVFSRHYTELRLFRRAEGRYHEDLGHGGRVWLPEARLGLGVWRGSYGDLADCLWLRWYDEEGHWISTKDELLEQERQRTEQERQRARQAEERATRLAALLRQLGHDPEDV